MLRQAHFYMKGGKLSSASSAALVKMGGDLKAIIHCDLLERWLGVY
ncbi:MAG: hypothetical protein ACJAZ1_001543 [Yoonia sp.]|jgi:hypothetical protein